MNEDVVRVLAPQVLGILVRRGNDFAAAEDAMQDALLEAHRSWGDAPPDDPKGWLLTVAGRKLIDARRSEAARRRREDALGHEPEPGPAEQADDTLLLFLCCHPRSRSARSTAHEPGLTPSRSLRCGSATITGSTRCVPACTSGRDTSTSQPSTTPARQPGRVAPPSGTTSPSKRPD